MSPSPVRCRGPWKLQKRTSESDRWLDELGFFRKHTARDPSCLFRAVSENIYNTQRYFHKVRLDTVQFMAENKHLFEGSLTCPFENYLKEMANLSEWGGLVEISAMSHLYRRDFVVFEANKGPQTKICNGYGDTILLFYSPETKYFDAVYTKQYINASAFCQSLVYEILYDGVYQLKDLPYAVEKMLHGKIPTDHIEYFMSENVERRKKQKDRTKIFIEASNDDDKDKNNNAVILKCKHHTQDLDRASLLKESLSIFVFNRSLIQLENVCMKCLNVNSAKDLLDNGITPFPYKVAKALDPDIYRNIEFDVWSELRRELRFGARCSDGMTLQVGVKCLCKLQPDQSVPYRCHIQEMRPDGGPCLVFIEELGEKRVVNYDQLEPLPLDEIRPWAPPYRYSRAHSQFLTLSQMLQQIGNVSKKQGLNKGRNKANKIGNEETKSAGTVQKTASEFEWKDSDEIAQFTPAVADSNMNYSMFQHLDLLNFQPMPVEIQALPLMVDCRAGPGGGGVGGAGTGGTGGAQEVVHANGAAANADTHHNQTGAGTGAGDMARGMTPPAARASTPATTALPTTYSGGITMNASGTGGQITTYPGQVSQMPPMGMGVGMGMNCAPYMCGMKSVVWCAPHSPPPHAPPPHGPSPPPPPPTVNPCVYKSVQPNGADLPIHDIPTLRYYFNLGVECMWAMYGPPPPHPHPPPAPHHVPHVHPPQHHGHYEHRDLAQDMQQMSLQERGGHSGGEPHKHKPALNQNKNGHGQRPLLGPRFNKRGNNQETGAGGGGGGGGQNSHSHSQNKPHNNMQNNRGPNNRRNSHMDGRNNHPQHYAGGGGGATGGGGAEGECVLEPPLLALPYIPYPPPMYPVQYYPVDTSDPAMMGMVSSIPYVSYEEGMEYGAPMQPYYGPPPPAPPHTYPPPPPQASAPSAPPTNTATAPINQHEHK